MQTSIEHRVHERVSFFLVPHDREQVPVWVFKPHDLAQGHAGLVLNMGQGGLQVLTPADARLTALAYDIQIIAHEGESGPRFHARVHRVWTREATSREHLHGFAFDQANSSAEEFIRACQASGDERTWVRCVVMPIDAV